MLYFEYFWYFVCECFVCVVICFYGVVYGGVECGVCGDVV